MASPEFKKWTGMNVEKVVTGSTQTPRGTTNSYAARYATGPYFPCRLWFDSAMLSLHDKNRARKLVGSPAAPGRVLSISE
ncbi:hypothetical protein AAE478_006601 [Parahypoxylon ruwenzoriense]